MNDKIIARVVRSGGGAWDVAQFSDTGLILRPHPDAGGGAHPRYMTQGVGFLCISPSFGLLRYDDEILGEGKVVTLEWRKTKKGERFVAVLPAQLSAIPTHLLVLASWSPDELSPVEYIFKGTDSTATGRDVAVESAFVVKIGDEIWQGETSLMATAKGLQEGIPGISASDLGVLGGESQTPDDPGEGEWKPIAEVLVGFGVEKEMPAAFAAVCQILTEIGVKTYNDPVRGIMYLAK